MQFRQCLGKLLRKKCWRCFRFVRIQTIRMQVNAMADSLTPDQRHRTMSHIRAQNTGPEMIVRKYLYAQGFRYRLYSRALPGKPDIVLGKYKTVIFIHGCFWHGHHGCKYYRQPKSNKEYWIAKIASNITRDAINLTNLKELRWTVITVWECELKKNAEERCIRLVKEIKTHKRNMEEAELWREFPKKLLKG